MIAVDVMGFAGSMACGVDQAGFDVIAKREPIKFRGFGVDSMQYNMPWIDAQVSDPEDWALTEQRPDLVFGCPPCSGFSQLSAVNTKVYEHTGTTFRGIDAEINECMQWLQEFAADARPQTVIMESVGPAFKIGRPWMESLWQLLRDRSGLDYELTHVNMNAAFVGGDVVRPRYFSVAHLQPFGIGLEFVSPRSFEEVVGDLGPDDHERDDLDWGHVTVAGKSAERVRQTIEWLEDMGREWKPGTRLPQNTEGLDPPDWWKKDRPHTSRRGYDPNVYSHWYSTDPFSPARWRAERPFGVIVAASLDRAIHPTEPRPITFREAARFMSLPDTWSMRVIAEKNRPAELGKAVPSASAKWIAHWAKKSIEGTPGEYAGRDDGTPGVRVIDVQRMPDILRVLDHPDESDVFLEGEVADPSVGSWIIDLKQRPRAWWQREDQVGVFDRVGPEPRPSGVDSARPPRTTQRASAPAGRGSIERVRPETVASLLSDLKLTRADAAKALDVSGSRIAELTTDRKPGSWLNADRWTDVQEALRAASRDR